MPRGIMRLPYLKGNLILWFLRKFGKRDELMCFLVFVVVSLHRVIV